MPTLGSDAEVQQTIVLLKAAPPFGGVPKPNEWWLWLLKKLEADASYVALEQPVLFWSAMAFCLVLLLVIGWHLAWSLRRLWRAARQRSATSTASVRPAGLWSLELAQQAMARGAYREAIEVAFAVCRQSHATSDTVRMTPRQWLRHGFGNQASADRVGAVTALAKLHERVCYADEAVTKADAEDALAWARLFGRGRLDG